MHPSGLGFSSFSFGLRAYSATQRGIATSIERLATGQRINRASDDPVGLQAVTEFDAQAKRLGAEIDRLEQDNYWLAAREGGLGAISDLVLGLQGAIVEAANTGGLGEGELDALQTEVDGILDGIQFVLQTTKFKGQLLFSETLSSFGRIEGEPDDDGEQVLFSLADLRTGGRLSLTGGDLEKAQESVEGAVRGLAAQRGGIGAKMQQNDAFISSKSIELEAITGAASSIRDTDFAAETAELVRLQVLEQAQLAAMTIGHQNASSVLALLESNVDGVKKAPAGPLG